ncbi:MAG: KpsF/GutQ family sugar-phosphate isomerase [Spirochaetota bacterium]|jgi:arabinose-5-phosphate isomerase|nr:KpsF/GutQ family sugar-phosphate isomerase [Spirochaetota bacterium]
MTAFPFSEARAVLEMEAAAIVSFAERLDAAFAEAVLLLAQCRGRIIVSGMGKSGHIARKTASTFSSTGSPALFLHPAECAHGDFGVIAPEDIVILLSKSGETAEVVHLLPHLKRLGARIIAITNGAENTLARFADAALVLGVETEACPLNLAPTCSTTVMLALGDALAVVLMRRRSFGRDDFARVHPAGSLGRMLLTVRDLMQTEDLPSVTEDATVREALHAILSHRNRGIVLVLDSDRKLAGVLCDGDLKRLLLRHTELLDLRVGDVMTKNPQTIEPGALIGEALARMEGLYTSLVVLDDDSRPAGLLHIHDILEARLV